MKRAIILALITLLLSVNMFSQTATVTLTSEKQVIRGFGGINHPEWYSDLNAAERQLAFGNGAGQLGFTVLRTFVSDNSANWSKGIETAKYAYSQGAYVFASPWNPPAGQFITVNGIKRINPATYSQYADHLNSYVTYMKNQGVNLYAISVQNEPDYADQWTEWSPQEGVDFIKGYASRINCKLMTPESFQYRKVVYDPILNDATALANVSIFGTHLYGTQYADFPYALFKQKGAGKELWMTEVYTDSKYDANIWTDNYINDARHAIKVAEHIHYAMVEGNFQTYVFWPIRRLYALIHDGTADGQGNTPAAAGTATKRGYCMAQFSKWVRPGYVRVDATSIPTTNVFVSAYKKANDVVIVVINKNTTTKTLTLSIPGTQVTSWENYTTSATKNIAKGTNIAASSSFQVTLDAASVTTFVGVAANDVPVATISAPVDNSTYTAPASITINATATVGTGTITKVDFYNGTTLLGSDATSPYSYTWTNAPAGSYSICATATSSGGKTGQSCVAVKVNPAQAAYNGTPWPIPGTIQFENYDVGGNGEAYLDNETGNTGGATFRTDEDVDIENCTDAGTGYNLGYTTAGEWLEYTVNAASAGVYSLTVRAACNGDGRTVSLTSNGTTVASSIAIPNTADWQTWTDVKVNVTLPAGIQVLRLTIGATDYVNLNYMTFSSSTTAAPTVVTPVTYCQGATATALTATGTALKWYTVATGGTALTAAPIPTTTTVGSTSYYVSQTLNAIESARALLTVTVNATPLAPTVITPVNYIVGQTATALSATGTALKWYTVATAGTALAAAPVPSTIATGTTNYYVSQTTNACESPRANIAVVVGNATIQSISLKAGWNMIGCPLNGSTDITKALSSIWTNVSIVKNLDVFYDKSNPAALNSLLKVDFGCGYFVKVNSACVLDWIVK